MTQAQRSIQYPQSSLEKEGLRNRLALIDQASKSLDALVEQTAKTVEAQNATRLMLFALQTTKIRLDADRADTQSKITALYTPPLSDKPLRQLVAEKQSSEGNEQKALDKLSRQNNWGFSFLRWRPSAGQPSCPGRSAVWCGFAQLQFRQLGHQQASGSCRGSPRRMEKVQESDVVRSMDVLRQQLAESVSVQEAKLKSVQEESKQINRNLQLVVNPDTSAALDFHNQLTAAQLLLEIEAVRCHLQDSPPAGIPRKELLIDLTHDCQMALVAFEQYFSAAQRVIDDAWLPAGRRLARTRVERMVYAERV